MTSRPGEVVRFQFDGRDYEGRRGDTLAAALLANGVRRVATSVKLGRPRGIFSAGSEEPNALVQIETPFPEPMLPATTVELYDGLVATGLPGKGRLADRPDPARYDTMHAHCDVLVVGAGPAGLMAAAEAARGGARVILADERPEPGGSLLGTTDTVDGLPGRRWAADRIADLTGRPDVQVLCRTTVFGYYEDNYLVAVERRTDHLGGAAPATMTRERIWRIRARRVVLATGAHERFPAFAGNDLPGVMLAGAARTYVNQYGVRPGRRAVVFTANDSAYPAALDLAEAGIEIAAVVDVRQAPGAEWVRRCAERCIDVLTGHVVTAAEGEDEVSSVVIAPQGDPADEASNKKGPGGEAPSGEGSGEAPGGEAPGGEAAGGEAGRGARAVPADLLLVSGGWTPAVHLFSQAGGALRFDEEVGAFVPGDTRQAVEVAGSARGIATLSGCLSDGAEAGRRALAAAGFAVPDRRPLPAVEDEPPAAPARHLWLVPVTCADGNGVDGAGLDGGRADSEGGGGSAGADYRTHFVDLQRDVTVADVLRATGAGLRSVEHIKRYTTAGTAHDQGKTSGLLTSAITAHALGVEVAELGVTTFRAPYAPVSFAALAGRDRGHLHDPVRVTAMHDWHVDHGALFENVGQWKRPWYYPRVTADGRPEDMETAVLRECRAAREDVAMMDASTLGKIDVIGPDAAEFLDRLYTNMMSTLAVGSIRYGVMCGLDGMIFDDGTVIRLAEDHFLVTTTTGNAAAVLDWMEEWLQTEWPSLRVHCTSVTEHWATIALVGPRSREVLAGLAPDLAVDNASFPFMTWRDAEVAGIPARVCRISFSGELAYEINVRSWYGLALWEAVHVAGGTAGGQAGVTPYGTETMHVLRAEKGYPIIGQDTDGTVTPQDLGMAWVVSKKKADFIGKRSFSRVDTARPDRKQLVGLLPEDPGRLLPEGVHLVEPGTVRALGHVTSSYRSAALGRTFALALISGGRARIGEQLHAVMGEEMVPVTVTHHVLYDPKGAHRDG